VEILYAKNSLVTSMTENQSWTSHSRVTTLVYKVDLLLLTLCLQAA
jgi:hypothetical protein